MTINHKLFSQGKLGKAIKASLPLLVLLGGANASGRNQSSSSGSRRLSNNGVVFVADSQNAQEKGKDNRTAKINTKNRSPFGAFTVNNKKYQSATIKVDSQALLFLKNNNLLHAGLDVVADLSGNTLGRKNFSHALPWTNNTIATICTQPPVARFSYYNNITNPANRGCGITYTNGLLNSTSSASQAQCQALHDMCLHSGANAAPEFDDANNIITLTLNEDAGATTIADGANGIGVTDTDVGDTLTWSQGSAPSKGTTSISGTRSATGGSGDLPATYTYTPTANANGLDNFTVNVNDGNGGTDTIAVNVVINDIADITSDTVPANNTYGTGDNLDFTITFDESVTVTGTPRVALNIGGTTKDATYTSGSPGSTLTFRYSIEAGLNDSDGISVTSSIALNGGTIADTDGDGSGADLTNVSFAGTAGVLVVTNAAPEFDDADDSITLTLNEDTGATTIDDGANGIGVTDTDVGDTLTWGQGSTAPSKGTTSISGTRSATGSPGDLPATYTYTPTANANGPDSFTVDVNDGKGGADTITVNVTINGIADITSDSVPANNTYGTGDNLDFTITFDESVTVTGTPRVALNIGGTTKYATYTSGSPGSTLTFSYSIEAGLNDSDGISVSSSIALNSGTIADTDGNGSGADLTNVSFAGTTGVLVVTFDSDGNLTSAEGVSEPVALALSADTVGEAVDLFDFTLSDDGTLDGAAMGVSEIVINVSGTTSDADRAKVTWRLNGPDVSNVIGVYSNANKTITFSGLSVSIANGDSEVYTINAYYNNTGLTHGTTIILSVDGNSDLIVTGGGTSMGPTSAVTNGSGTIVINDTASIGHFIWNDIDGDDVQNGGEAGIDGVTLDLYADNDSSWTINTGDTLLATATTADGGAYDFAGLTPGDYIIDVTDTGTVLTGLLLTGGVNPYAVSLLAGEDENGADFGYRYNIVPVLVPSLFLILYE